MATDELDILATFATGSTDFASGLIWPILLLVLFGLGMWMAFYILSFRHTVIIRLLGNNGSKFPYQSLVLDQYD